VGIGLLYWATVLNENALKNSCTPTCEKEIFFLQNLFITYASCMISQDNKKI